MLYLLADLEDTSWLEYIVQEFVRIQGAAFSIKVLGKRRIVPKNSYVVRYSQRPSLKTFPNKSFVLPNGSLRTFSDTISILPGTEAGNGFSLPYDPFWNSFVFLSRLEEYQAFGQGNLNMSYASRHPRMSMKSFSIPIVNYIFDDLERTLKHMFPDLEWEAKQTPVVEFSHDVDYLFKTPQLRFKQTAMNCYNMLRGKTGVMATARFLFSNPSYWQFDYWRDLEESYDIRSVFYVYACSRTKSPRTWLLDPSYRVDVDAILQSVLGSLLEQGFEVGLHGSYDSAVDNTLLAEEKDVLETSLGCEVKKTRQHWLRYDENLTPTLHERLFSYDSTLGWNDCMGFRSGCASRYRPWSHVERRSLNYFVTPQVLMDSNIYDYGAGNVLELEEQALKMVRDLRSVKNAFVSVSWHQRVSSSDYNWHPLYERLLEAVAGL